ncbi:hypothetical protein ABEX78_21430 [Priestia megaterium]
MKLINCYTFYLKLLARTKVVPILLIGTFVYGIYVFYLYASLKDAPTTLVANPIVCGFMACYLFMGIYLGKIDEKEEIQETFGVIRNAILHKTVSKFLLVLSLVVLMTVFFFVLFVYFFFTKDFNDFTFFWSALKYIWLYWGMSSLIMFLTGNLLTLLLRGKLVYLLALIIFVVTIPINYAVFGTEIMTSSHFRVDKILNLGEPNLTRVYNSFYGFSLDVIHWDKKIFVNALLLTIYTLIWRKRKTISTTTFKILFIPLLVCLVGSSLYLTKPFQVLSDNDNIYKDYYRNYKDTDTRPISSSVSFKKYDIRLENSANLKAMVKIQAHNTGNTNIKQLNLTLFHELRIKQVKMDAKEIDFKQDGDLVTLAFKNSLWKPNDKREIEFEYSGLQSNLYFGNKQAVYLPNYFPWLPSENLSPAFSIVTKYHLLHRVPHQPNEKKEYHLVVKNGKRIHTNLKEVAFNTWEGSSSDGLSILSGQLTSKEDNGITYVFPNAWEAQFKQTDSIRNYLQNLMTAMKDTLNDKHIAMPHTIYFIPNQNLDDGVSGEGTWWNDNYLIWGFHQADYPYSGNPFFTKDHLGRATPELVFGETKRYEEYEKENDFSFNMLFSYAYSQALNNQFQLPNNDVEDSLDNLISSLSESSSSSETTRLLTLWLRSKSSTDANNHIYKEWYSLIQNPTPQKWNLLNDILKKEQVQ